MPYFSRIAERSASSTPATEKPIFLFLRSAGVDIGPSFKTRRQFKGVATSVPTLNKGRPSLT